MPALLTEVSDEIRSHSVRGPFPVDDVSIVLHIEAKLLVALGELSGCSCLVGRGTYATKLLQAPLRVIDCLDPLLSLAVSALQRAFVRL